MNEVSRIWFLTWTTYGTWLPGDERGFVSPKFEGDFTERRHHEPGTPYDRGRAPLRRIAESKRIGGPVTLDHQHAEVIRRQFAETARSRGWRLLAGAIMTSHVHLLVGVRDDPEPATLLRDFKSYASRALNGRFARPESGSWWTEQGSKRKVRDWENLRVLLKYIREQPHSLQVWEDEATGGERGASDPCPGAEPIGQRADQTESRADQTEN